MTKDNQKLIRNSTAEFLIFTGQTGEKSIEARYEDGTVWLTQKLMAELFEVSVPTINEHLKNIYETSEIAKAHAESEFEKYRIVQDRLFENDFDKIVKQLESEAKKADTK